MNSPLNSAEKSKAWSAFGTRLHRSTGPAVALLIDAGRDPLVTSAEVSKFWRSLDPSPRDPNSRYVNSPGGRQGLEMKNGKGQKRSPPDCFWSTLIDKVRPATFFSPPMSPTRQVVACALAPSPSHLSHVYSVCFFQLRLLVPNNQAILPPYNRRS